MVRFVKNDSLFWTQNHTLHSCTYLYGPYMAVPPLGDHLTFVKLFSFVKFFFGGGEGGGGSEPKEPKENCLVLEREVATEMFC